MPKLPDEHADPDSLPEQMKKRSDHPSPVASAHDTSLQVKYEDYANLRDVIDAQLRRKLAGEFPYNVLEREIVVSTSTFWQQIMIAALIHFTRVERPDITDEMLENFLQHIGNHPAAWGQFVDHRQVEAALLDFIE
jgi:hypothetical protein